MKKRREALARQNFPGAAAVRHEQMLDAAAKHLNASGVSLTSLSDIAESLGVSRATLYQYIEDREDLVFQCYRRSCEVMARHLGEAVRLGGDAAEVVCLFIDRMLDPTQPEIATRAEVAVLNQERHEIIQGLYDAIITRLAKVLETGARNGVMRECDTAISASTIISLVTWVPLMRFWAPAANAYRSEQIAATLKSFVLEGIATDRRGMPPFQPINLSPLVARVIGVFDRDAVVDAKRETLLAIASRLFNSKGIDSTSLEEIAGHVGATKRTLYHHLGDKQTLLATCYSRAFRIFLYIMECMTKYEGTRVQALAASFHALTRAYLRADLSPLAPLVGHEALKGETQAQMEPQAAALSEGYMNAMNIGRAEGSIRIDDVMAQLILMPGFLSWLVKDTGTHAEDRIEHIAREISAFLCLGLRKA
ncbi:MAG TPA: TetR/AcrR family transcriptional regulator [Povalibacter sp.]|uniref:TetR/AcrR family transcriptional regulator n=1 Tax=Povalibacter sp. TaxID=1962978 RepID=UPI002C2BB3F5|nr:TetR/AcrR family transcriptional regulator [Povalibacter sp.]HMN46191.1 TetR/AcrR family transcriptional regulator [Povalibacter sp.]